MNELVVISERAADSIRALMERSQRLQDTLQTYVEALGAQLDVPSGWRFDPQMMAFVPPVEQPSPDERHST